MPQYVIKLNEYYLQWSTIVDAPTVIGTREGIRKALLVKYGTVQEFDIDRMLARADKFGTSEPSCESVEETIRGNRAGPDEDELTTDELYRAYCLAEPIRNGWSAYPE